MESSVSGQPNRLSMSYKPDRLQGRTQGGLGLTPPVELDIVQKNYHLRKEINCFRILFAC